MESQPRNAEFRINPENFYSCIHTHYLFKCLVILHSFSSSADVFEINLFKKIQIMHFVCVL